MISFRMTFSSTEKGAPYPFCLAADRLLHSSHQTATSLRKDLLSVCAWAAPGEPRGASRGQACALAGAQSVPQTLQQVYAGSLPTSNSHAAE